MLNTGDVDPAASAAADDEYKEDEDEAFSPATKRRAKRSTTKDKEKDKGPKKNAAFRLVRNLNRILDELVRLPPRLTFVAVHCADEWL